MNINRNDQRRNAIRSKVIASDKGKQEINVDEIVLIKRSSYYIQRYTINEDFDKSIFS